MKDNLIVAGIQISSIPNNIPKNIEKICFWIKKCVKEIKPDIIVLPETVTTGFTPNISKRDLWNLIDFIPGKTTEPICKSAKENNAYIVFPTYERGENSTIYNSAALISPKGEILGVYRKTHLFPTERKWSTPGDKICVFKTEIANIGIIICYDGDFPELSRILALKGAEIIARPSAFLRSYDIWNLTNCARAYDNHVYIIAVNSVGIDNGNNIYFGNSMIVSPLAQKLAQACSQEEIIYAKLSSNPLKNISYGVLITPMIFHHIEDRNIKVYKEILNESKANFEYNKDYVIKGEKNGE